MTTSTSKIATRTQTSSTSLLTVYMNSQRAGNELLDFAEGLYDSDVPLSLIHI